jgi:hypothetical protein
MSKKFWKTGVKYKFFAEENKEKLKLFIITSNKYPHILLLDAPHSGTPICVSKI